MCQMNGAHVVVDDADGATICANGLRSCTRVCVFYLHTGVGNGEDNPHQSNRKFINYITKLFNTIYIPIYVYHYISM